MNNKERVEKIRQLKKDIANNENIKAKVVNNIKNLKIELEALTNNLINSLK
jgi:hypothetical protein